MVLVAELTPATGRTVAGACACGAAKQAQPCAWATWAVFSRASAAVVALSRASLASRRAAVSVMRRLPSLAGPDRCRPASLAEAVCAQAMSPCRLFNGAALRHRVHRQASARAASALRSLPGPSLFPGAAAAVRQLQSSQSGLHPHRVPTWTASHNPSRLALASSWTGSNGRES